MIPFWALMLAKKATQAAWNAAQKKAAHDRAIQQAHAAREQAERLAIERAQPCCGSCSIEVALKAAFCHACGSPKITTRGVILDREAAAERLAKQQAAKKQAAEKAKEAAEKSRAEEERKWREYRSAARRRCREILTWRYCEPCHLTFEPSHKFCTRCGGPTHNLPRPFAVEYASRDFPDLIEKEADFDALA